MAFYRRWSKRVGTINFQCSRCQAQGPAALFKKRSLVLLFFIIPIWYRKSYYVTCGHCFGSFKIEKGRGTQLEKQVSQQAVSSPPIPSGVPTPTATVPTSSVAVASKFCTHCGARTASSATFCSTCGAKQ